MKKVLNKRVTAKMVKVGALTRGDYVLTKNYLVVPAKDHKKASEWLAAHKYSTDGQNLIYKDETQVSIIYINR